MSLAPLYAMPNGDGTYRLVIPIAEQDGELIYIEAHEVASVLAQEWERDSIQNLKRPRIPLQIIPVPDSPEGRQCREISETINRIATFHFRSENQDKASVLRCIQLYWGMRALWISNEICGQIVPAVQQRYIRHLMPKIDFKALTFKVPYDVAMYRLIQAGAIDIQNWCRKQGIDYPFTNSFDLFLETLHEEFLRSQQYCFELTDHHLQKRHGPTKREQQDDHRRWVKFLAQNIDADAEPEKYKECIDVLWNSGWTGRVLLALWTQPSHIDLRQHRKAVARTYRKMIHLIGRSVLWKDNHPALRSKTPHLIFLKAKTSPLGYFSFDN